MHQLLLTKIPTGCCEGKTYTADVAGLPTQKKSERKIIAHWPSQKLHSLMFLKVQKIDTFAHTLCLITSRALDGTHLIKKPANWAIIAASR